MNKWVRQICSWNRSKCGKMGKPMSRGTRVCALVETGSRPDPIGADTRVCPYQPVVKVAWSRAPGICGRWQDARRSRCLDIGDDEQRRPAAANPWRHSGCGGVDPSVVLHLLDDDPASPRSARLASGTTALATRPAGLSPRAATGTSEKRAPSRKARFRQAVKTQDTEISPAVESFLDVDTHL